jgi:hypothetical protein
LWYLGILIIIIVIDKSHFWDNRFCLVASGFRNNSLFLTE